MIVVRSPTRVARSPVRGLRRGAPRGPDGTAWALGRATPPPAVRAAAVQQRRGADRAGPEPPGGAVGGEVRLAPAVFPRAELPLLRRGADVDQPLRADPDQPDPGAIEPEGVEQRPGGPVELVPDVGGDRPRPAAGDRGEVGEAPLDADRA